MNNIFSSPTQELGVVSTIKDEVEKNAINAIISHLEQNGFVLATDLVLRNENGTYRIYDFKDNQLFVSYNIVRAVHQFVKLETPISIFSKFNIKEIQNENFTDEFEIVVEE